MHSKTIKEVMVPISKYATVSKDANLFEAICAIEDETLACGDLPFRHQSVIIVGEDNRVLGKVSQIDIMRAMEPNYTKVGSEIDHRLHRFGYSLEMLKDMYEGVSLWDKNRSELCKLAVELKVTDFMYKPDEGEFINESDDLFCAMHRIVMGRHRSLLVMRGEGIVGILRSTDLFHELSRIVKDCMT